MNAPIASSCEPSTRKSTCRKRSPNLRRRAATRRRGRRRAAPESGMHRARRRDRSILWPCERADATRVPSRERRRRGPSRRSRTRSPPSRPGAQALASHTRSPSSSAVRSTSRPRRMGVREAGRGALGLFVFGREGTRGGKAGKACPRRTSEKLPEKLRSTPSSRLRISRYLDRWCHAVQRNHT